MTKLNAKIPKILNPRILFLATSLSVKLKVWLQEINILELTSLRFRCEWL